MKIIINDKIVYKVMSRLLVIRAPHAGPNKFFRTGQRYENIVSDVPAPAWRGRLGRAWLWPTGAYHPYMVIFSKKGFFFFIN